MAYQIDRFSGSFFITIDDQTINTTASDLRFVGKNYAGYGEIQNENFLHLLENFANTSAPPRPIQGQIWYDSSSKKIRFYDGTRFKFAGGAEIGTTVPTGASTGDFWFDTNTNQLKIYDGTEYILVGPDLAPLYGSTASVPDQVKDTTGTDHSIIKLQVGGEIIAIISNSDFLLNSVINPISGFSFIKKGFTLINSDTTTGVTSSSHRFWGTVGNSERLNGFTSDDFIKSSGAAFVTQVSFADSGFVVGDDGDLRISIVDGNEPTFENRLNSPFYFAISNDGLEKVNVVRFSRSGLEPGGSGLYDLGSSGNKWNDLYIENIRTNNIVATGDVSISGTFEFSDIVGSATPSDFTVGLLGTSGTISLQSGETGTIENFNIGINQPRQAKFTTVTTTGKVNVTDTTESLNLSSGALIVSGGAAINGNANISGDVKIYSTGALTLPAGFTNDRPTPEIGMLRFNRDQNQVETFDGSLWKSLGTAILQDNAPTGSDGLYWYKTNTNQLYIYYGTSWNLIGPEAIEGYGRTRQVSETLRATNSANFPVITTYINNSPIAILSNDAFTIDQAVTPRSGFSNIIKGLNLVETSNLQGSSISNAATASRLATPRRINGTFFDGQADVTIKSSTTNILTRGSYLTGSNFDGSAATTWAVNANTTGTSNVVARDASGNFSAGTITATLSGNASTATRLQTARTINGVSFDGSANVTIVDSTRLATAGGTMTGAITLAAGISGGVRWPNDAYGGGGDTASITLESVSGERTRLRFRVTNDAGITTVDDKAEFLVPDNDSLLVNGYPVLNSGNMRNYITGSWGINITGNAATATTASNSNALNGYASSTSRTGNTIARRDSAGNIYANTFVATSADLAEKYLADDGYQPGTVLEFGGEKEVTVAEEETTRVAGVVSTEPGFTMNEKLKGDNVVVIAFQGRIPCKVKGKIRKGDMLTSAGQGYAKAIENPKLGSVIGKALENFDGDYGVIEIAVGRI